jgi:gliding motility-associated-like protein
MSSVVQSVHPRIFSPNGDGYNDIVHFDLINPDQQPVSGEIFDLQAAKVADLQPSPLGLQWDGKGRGGRIVPGGVYIYQIRVGHQRVNGTVVVVK